MGIYYAHSKIKKYIYFLGGILKWQLKLRLTDSDVSVRLAFRQMFGAEGYEVVAINDLTSPKMLAHLLKYDSSQGKICKFRLKKIRLQLMMKLVQSQLMVRTIKIYAEPDANNCPWGELDVDVVLECSGFYTSKAKAQAHINAGAKKVVISAPAGNDLTRQSFTM